MEETAQFTTAQTAIDLGLMAEEFELIKEILGRVPNFTELSIYSVMWSEHCSYKNSIKWLKTLPREADHILVEAGEENAGLVDIGDGLACAFKIESHNHPSAIEPYQGAATGVGGIHRDIFTMGARPLAALNSLRFGNLSDKRTKHLLKGVVKGIGDYGNAFGVPTVGGEVYFEECYQVNPLVNAMSVGTVKVGETVSAIASGTGNPVYIVGSATGKDGIAGAAFASKDLSEDAESDLPAVQVGDPFQEKLLLEASLEAIATGALIGMQDMGAAGITCSTSEMSEKGEVGMRIYLDKVPTRQANMKPYEILLSESQERMLVVVKKGRESEITEIFEKWDLNCTEIGEVVDGDTLTYYMDGEKVAEVPATSLCLGAGAPVYEREYTEPAYFSENKAFDTDSVEQPEDYVAVAKALCSAPSIASKRWIYRQYDAMVGIDNTNINDPADAPTIRIKGTNRGIAMAVDCNARYVHLDPFVGAQIAVAESARNIVCSGGKPLAITNCLNFGNPYNPEVYWQFVHAIKGMTAACEKLKTPVTGGNVSFYNQSHDGTAVFPTPTIGMIGLVDDLTQKMTLDFKAADDLIYILGECGNDINGSHYLYHVRGIKNTPAPHFDLDEEFTLQECLLDLIRDKRIVSAHDVSDGGLFMALIESALPSNLGFEIKTDDYFRKDGYLFGEGQSRVVVSVKPEYQNEFEDQVIKARVPLQLIGKVTDGNVKVDKDDTGFGNITIWKELFDNALENALKA